ncbi:HDIG domain-containing protein [Candidatus Berkelbacteria bacterium]|nr:HDIG domain-containing protein [Candidatus Berkelbacteria bacterium]
MNRTVQYALILFGAITTINFIVLFLFNLIGRTYGFSPIGRFAMIFAGSAVAGAATTLVVISTAPVLRDFLATFRRLLRVDSLTHPLLVRLSQEAPSTYHHALMVANFAHRAAKAIGADPLLARIGAYYHDIGKLGDPTVYTENQRGEAATKNHDDVSPKQSAKLIINHVKAGLKLAKEHNLPEEIADFIPQHHGTTTARFFYQKAVDQGLKVKKTDFRYPGPKPLSKEAAILMLADGVESKIRSLPALNDHTITEAVDSIFEERLADEQLVLSGVTESDLKKIRASFIDSAKIFSHRRIRYPRG